MVDNLEPIVVGDLVAPLGAHVGSSSIVLDGEIEDSTLSTALAMVPVVPNCAGPQESVRCVAENGPRMDDRDDVSRRGMVLFSGKK